MSRRQEKFSRERTGSGVNVANVLPQDVLETEALRVRVVGPKAAPKTENKRRGAARAA
jgi:phosphosulfolactate synthase (CoM biosynthesis protein A)